MSSVRVRNIDDGVKQILKDRAALQGLSLESYLRNVLREEALRSRRQWAERLKADRAELEAKYGLFSDSAELIRAEREQRGW